MTSKHRDSGRAKVARGGVVKRAAAVERAVAAIPGVAREASIELALEIGQIVFERVFRGDGDAMRLRGRKDVSFRKLANHPSVDMSASKLWACCAIYELSLRWPELRETSHLVLAHLRCVLGLPPSEQKRLLARAEKGRWSVSKLADQVAGKRRGRGGRPPKSKMVRLLEGVNVLRDASPQALRDKAGLAALTGNEVAASLKATVELRRKLAALETVLRQAKARDVPTRRPKVPSYPRRSTRTARRPSR